MVRVICEAGHKLIEAYVDPAEFPDGCPLCPECALRWLLARVKKLEAVVTWFEYLEEGDEE